MKKKIIIILLSLAVAFPSSGYAEKKSKKMKPYYGYDREENFIDRAGDWVATFGKSEKEKKKITIARQSQRRLKRNKDRKERKRKFFDDKEKKRKK